MTESWLNRVNWAADGLVPAIAQDAATGTRPDGGVDESRSAQAYCRIR